MNQKIHKIIFSGGGTGGSVSPLLAVAEALKNPSDHLNQGSEYKFLWLGTKNGPERQMVERAGVEFKEIFSGKFRRYFSWHNFIDLIKIKLAFFQSLVIMFNWRPDLVMSAGGFVSVPVVWAAWVRRVPVIIHQQDVRPGLANRLMAPLAKIITVTFEKSLADYGKKAAWTGNPVRQELRIKNYELKSNNFNLQKDLPVVLILGGGTGAMAINKLVEESLGELTKFYRVIHITGREKGIRNKESGIKNYFQHEFLAAVEMAEAMKLADVVVTRAGMGVLSELSSLGKPAIIIPLPDSHQEENAEIFRPAALVLEQKDLTAEIFTNRIKELVNNKDLQKSLSENIARAMKRGAEAEIAKIIRNL